MHGFVTPVWIRLPRLPLYCWGSKSLTHIASLLGKPIWTDHATATMERGSFARVCVRIDLSKPLIASVTVLGLNDPFQQWVEYEGLSNFCFKCGRVGHKDTNCSESCSSYNMNSNSYASNISSQGKTYSIHKEVTTYDANAKPCMGEELLLDKVTSNIPSQNSFKDTSMSSALNNPKLHGTVDVSNEFGPWMLVQRRKRHSHPRKSACNGHLPALDVSPKVTVPSFNIAKPLETSSSPLQVSVCAAQPKQSKVKGLPSSQENRWNSLLQNSETDMVQAKVSPPLPMLGTASTALQVLNMESNDMECPPLTQLESALVQTEMAQVPHVSLEVPMVFSAANLQKSHDTWKESSLVQHEYTCKEDIVFSSNSPKFFGNGAAFSMALVNSNRATKYKANGSYIKAKQVFYDAGSLIVESHKKRRSSIQSVGEDASSTKPP